MAEDSLTRALKDLEATPNTPLVSEHAVSASSASIQCLNDGLPEGQISLVPPRPERQSRVLVVEPQSQRRAQIGEVLAGEEYEAMLLEDAEEVLRLRSEWEPDLILLSADLPDGVSYEICGRLRATDPRHHTPVILMGGINDEENVARGLLAGADDYVHDIQRNLEFRARLRVQLRNKRSFDALHRVRGERDILKRDARLDPLTNVMNRRALDIAISNRMDEDERFGILFIDIDHFKSINDSYGHEMGDDVLVAVAETLKAGIRPGDVLGRYGGEEFVALVAGAGPESVRLVAERLRASVEELPRLEGGPEKVTVSLGASVFDPQAKTEDSAELLRSADKALYAAKLAGRNRVVSIMPDEDAAKRSNA